MRRFIERRIIYLRRKAQSLLEYVFLIGIILAVLIIGATTIIKPAINYVLGKVKDTLETHADELP